MAEAHVYTDHACPWSWAAEPALRAMEAEFGDGLEVRFVMGGLVRLSRQAGACSSTAGIAGWSSPDHARNSRGP